MVRRPSGWLSQAALRVLPGGHRPPQHPETTPSAVALQPIAVIPAERARAQALQVAHSAGGSVQVLLAGGVGQLREVIHDRDQIPAVNFCP
jgi:hypothetical protein